MRNQDYWKRRMEALEASRARQSVELIEEFDRQHQRAVRELDKEISRWYRRFAANNNISMSEARRLLTTRELMEFRWDVQDYIKFGQENALDQRWMRELENASARVHISRLAALKLQLQQQAEAVYANQLDAVDKHLRRIYSEGYYRTAFELQRGIGVGYNHALDARRLERLLDRPWVPDERTFSDRLWTHKATLVGELQTHLKQAVITGQPPDVTIGRIAQAFNASKHRAGRLVMTESAAFASMAQRDCFTDLGVERYEIVATLDMLTSEICQELDGKVFLLRDYAVGATAPPFHPWCRTVTAPYFDDNPSERIARAADGQLYHVPASMTYREWYQSFVLQKHPGYGVINVRTARGDTVKAVKTHFPLQMDARGVTAEGAVEALTTPLHVTEVKLNKRGEPSVQYIGAHATVAFNPDTQTVVSTWRTGERTRKKHLKRGGQR